MSSVSVKFYHTVGLEGMYIRLNGTRQQDSELSVKEKVCIFGEISILLVPC